MNDSQMIYALQQAFFPLQRTVPPTILVRVCIELGEIQSESCNREGQSGEPAFSINDTSIRKCWVYQWTSSSLLALLTVDELLAFDNTIFIAVYCNIGPTLSHNIDLELQPESLPCMPTSNEMKTTLATLLSWVCVQLPETICFCMTDYVSLQFGELGSQMTLISSGSSSLIS